MIEHTAQRLDAFHPDDPCVSKHSTGLGIDVRKIYRRGEPRVRRGWVEWNVDRHIPSVNARCWHGVRLTTMNPHQGEHKVRPYDGRTSVDTRPARRRGDWLALG